MVNVTRVSGASVDYETMLQGFNGANHLGICSMNVGTGMTSISGYGGPNRCIQFLSNGTQRRYDGKNVFLFTFKPNHKRDIVNVVLWRITINQPFYNKHQFEQIDGKFRFLL